MIAATTRAAYLKSLFRLALLSFNSMAFEPVSCHQVDVKVTYVRNRLTKPITLVIPCLKLDTFQTEHVR